MHVRVLPEGDVLPVPQQLRLGCAHLAPWTTRPFDPQWLCEEALKRCETTLPAAASFVGGPLELSYWLAANLPLGTRSRYGAQRVLTRRTCKGRERAGYLP